MSILRCQCYSIYVVLIKTANSEKIIICHSLLMSLLDTSIHESQFGKFYNDDNFFYCSNLLTSFLECLHYCISLVLIQTGNVRKF